MHTYSIVISAYSVSEGENYIESPSIDNVIMRNGETRLVEA